MTDTNEATKIHGNRRPDPPWTDPGCGDDARRATEDADDVLWGLRADPVALRVWLRIGHRLVRGAAEHGAMPRPGSWSAERGRQLATELAEEALDGAVYAAALGIALEDEPGAAGDWDAGWPGPALDAVQGVDAESAARWRDGPPAGQVGAAAGQSDAGRASPVHPSFWRHTGKTQWVRK